MRILFVTPRYGEVAGGAEVLCRSLATRCCDGWDVEVATTCVTNLFTCENDLPAGEETVDGILVRRFPASIGFVPSVSTEGSYLEEVRRFSRSLWSQELHSFLVEESERFDLLIFAPYLFGTTFWGAQVRPDRSALIPCLHDEAEARLAPMGSLFARVRGALLNTPTEERLARRLYSLRESHVVGIGIDPPAEPADVEAFRTKYGVNREYLLYCGRLEEGKRVDTLARLVRRHNEGLAPDRRIGLVLAGEGPYKPTGGEVQLVGFLPEETKRAALAGARAFATASVLESLSIVALEAWREGTPVLAPSACEVLADHIAASGGGATFSNSRTFSRALEQLGDPATRHAAGEAGRSYVQREYGWEGVRARFRRGAELLAA
jgi:glycosyltransferase involved in cell wall biosynthesis